MKIDLEINKKFEHVFQISDIHVRLFKRHAEYKKVFENFYKELDVWKADNPDKGAAIVVTGDIVHSKIDMSPELVSLVATFFQQLSTRFPTFILLGNHDCLINNKSRLDSLSPIIDSIQNDNLFYLKDSGVYTAGNIDFAIMSVLSPKEDWPTAEDCDNEYAIALYHGPVYNATTDTGYAISSRYVEISHFDGFDMVMLGDIHQQQILQLPSKNKPLIAYAGSMIQQNHGENLDGHGYILWDLPNQSLEFFDVKNPYGYVTFNIKKGKKFTLPPLPENVRLRIISEDAPTSRIKKILTMVRKNHTVIESSINRLPSSNVSGSIIGTIEVNDVEYQNKLLIDFINKNVTHLSKETVDKVIEINESLNQNISDDDLPRNVLWTPVEFEFGNLFSYGTGNTVDFSSMKGVYGLFSPNATGKSAFMDSICFSIYDKTPRAFKGDRIMNTREDDCNSKFVFDIGNKRYKIEKAGTRKPNGSVKVDIDFSFMDDSGKWESLNGKDRNETNYIIRSYLGEYEDFILTNLSTQGQNALFIDRGQSDRKDLAGRFMGLSIYDKLYELALDGSRDIQSTMKRFNKEDFTEELSGVHKKIEEVNEDYLETKEKYDRVITEKKKVLKKITSLHGKLKSIENLNISDLKDERERVQNELSRLMDLRSQLESDVDDYEGQLEEIKISVSKYPSPQEVKEGIAEYSKALDKYHAIKSNMGSIKSEVNHIKQKISWLDEHEYDPNCSFCVNNIFLKDAKEAQYILEIKQEELESLGLRLENTDNDVKELDRYNVANKKLQDLANRLSKIKNNKELTLARIDKTSSDIDSLNKDETRITEDIETYNKNQRSIENNAKINLQITEQQNLYAEIENEETKLNNRVQGLYADLEVLKSKKSELINRIKEAEELQVLYEAYQAYLKAVSRNGIPYQLISKILPSVESKVNSLLSDITEFQVLLEVDGKNINGKIVYGPDRSWPLELASGMERFISGIAIRVALMHLSCLPKSNFLILDEGFGVLDGNNLAQIFNLFEVLKQEYDFIILISHLEVVRDISDSLLEIKREDGYSYITI